MLAMKLFCESCEKALPAASPWARICADEHTYCAECATERWKAACPQCSGRLVARPRRLTVAAQVGEPCFRSAPFAPREVRFHGVTAWGDWRAKRYSIRFASRAIPGPATWAQAEAIASAVLRAAAPGGAAFLTLHAAAGGDYLLVDWWSDEDILNHRLFYRTLSTELFSDSQPSSWMACVWELRVLEAERRFWQQSTMSHAPERYFDLALPDGLLD